MRHPGVALLGALIPMLAAGAQRAPASLPTTLHPGARVRLEAPAIGLPYLAGTVVSDGDTLVVHSWGRVQGVPRRAVAKLEVYRGCSRLLGARNGARVGAGIGLVLGLGDPIELAARSVLVSTLWFTAFGAALRAERWEPVPPPGATRTSMTVRPWVAPDGRVGMVATLR